MKSKTLTLLKPAIVLTVICLTTALLLSVVNHFTAPVIAKKEQEKYLATLGVVLPAAEGFEEIELKNAPKTVKAVYKETSGKGYALLMQAESGYHTLEFSLGIDAESKISGISFTTPFHSAGNAGLGNALETFLDSYIGVKEDLSGSVDKVTNATNSSAAMRAAMADAFALIESLKGGA